MALRAISEDGYTVFQFCTSSEDVVSLTSRESKERRLVIESETSEGKGKGLMIIINEIAPNKVIFENQDVASVVLGLNRNHICHCCYQNIDASLLNHYRYPPASTSSAPLALFYYCSEMCFQADENFYSFYEDLFLSLQPSLSSIEQSAESYHHSESTQKRLLLEIQLLLCRIIYEFVHISQEARVSIAEKIGLLQVLDLFYPPESLIPSSTDYQLFQPLARKLSLYLDNTHKRTIKVVESLFSMTIDSDWIYQLLLIIRYNCQTIGLSLPRSHPISTTPATSITSQSSTILSFSALSNRVEVLSMFPMIARINHSCQPNCVLLHDVMTPPSEDKRTTVIGKRGHLRVSVVSTSLIPRDTELTVSYLVTTTAISSGGSSSSSSSLPVTTRRALLKEGFHFPCDCDRCQRELLVVPPEHTESNSNKKSKQKASDDSIEVFEQKLTEHLQPQSTKDLNTPQQLYDYYLLVNRRLEEMESVFSDIRDCLYPIERITASGLVYDYLLFAIQNMNSRLLTAMDLASFAVNPPNQSTREAVFHIQYYFTYIHIILRVGLLLHQYYVFLSNAYVPVVKKEREDKKKLTPKKDLERSLSYYSLEFIELFLSILLLVLKITHFTHGTLLTVLEEDPVDLNQIKNESNPQIQLLTILQSMGVWTETYLTPVLTSYHQISHRMSLCLTVLANNNNKNNSNNHNSSSSWGQIHYLLQTIGRMKTLLQRHLNPPST